MTEAALVDCQLKLSAMQMDSDDGADGGLDCPNCPDPTEKQCEELCSIIQTRNTGISVVSFSLDDIGLDEVRYKLEFNDGVCVTDPKVSEGTILTHEKGGRCSYIIQVDFAMGNIITVTVGELDIFSFRPSNPWDLFFDGQITYDDLLKFLVVFREKYISDDTARFVATFIRAFSINSLVYNFN